MINRNKSLDAQENEEEKLPARLVQWLEENKNTPSEYTTFDPLYTQSLDEFLKAEAKKDKYRTMPEFKSDVAVVAVAEQKSKSIFQKIIDYFAGTAAAVKVRETYGTIANKVQDIPADIIDDLSYSTTRDILYILATNGSSAIHYIQSFYQDGDTQDEPFEYHLIEEKEVEVDDSPEFKGINRGYQLDAIIEDNNATEPSLSVDGISNNSGMQREGSLSVVYGISYENDSDLEYSVCEIPDGSDNELQHSDLDDASNHLNTTRIRY